VDYGKLKDSLVKLHLNDASFSFEPETSQALGFGFRCGFLGLLHLEVIEERLEREYNLDLVTTAPSVVYKVHLNSGQVIDLHNPADMPDPSHIDFLEEPWIVAKILVPDEYLGNVLALCEEKRGIQDELTYVGSRVLLEYRLPLNEVVYDFYDRLKSISRGYASFDYHLHGYVREDLVKMTILINGELVDALSMVVYRGNAEYRGRILCERLKDLIPRHMFKIPIQAAIGGKIIARETIAAFRKDVTAKCYGGDISRKRKLLDKQREGKKKMREIGNVKIPQKTFLAALKMDNSQK
jgi:GTP-binding protein LepA